MLVLANLKSYSQTKVLTTNGDTATCFTNKKADFLLKSYYKSKELAKIDSLNKAELAKQREVIKDDSLEISNYRGIISNKDVALNFKDNQLSGAKNQLKTYGKEIKRQKILKVLGTGIGIVFGLFVGLAF